MEVEQILTERYQLKHKLGQNSGRQTWLAKDLQAEPPEVVVVKLLAFGGEIQWDDLKLFEREAQVLKQLNYPRIPQYRDYFSVDDRILWFGLVQEYIPGESLKEEVVRGQRFTEKQVRQIAAEVLNILTYLHQLNPTVLHRDIKPSNLIRGEDGHIYLVDFGAVQDRAAKEGATFTVVGTYGYAPMEQFGGRAIPASDLYALGATLIHLLTGIAPADLPQKDLRIQFQDQVNLTPGFRDWLDRLTDPVPERRFSTAQQALTSLKSGLKLAASRRKSPSPSACVQPIDSRVELNQSFDRLDINIRARGVKNFSDTLNLLGTVFFFVLLYGWLGMIWHSSSLMGLIVLIGFIVFVPLATLPMYWEQTHLVFDRDRFWIEHRLFGFVYACHSWSTSLIQYIFCREKNQRREIMIQVRNGSSNHEYSFGRSLTPAEQAWLTEEIQTWLRLIN